MEIPQSKSLSQLSGMENSCFNFQWPVNSIDDQLSSMTGAPAAYGENMHQLHVHAPLFEYPKPVMEPSSRPTKQFETDSSGQSLMNQNLIDGGDSSNQNYYVFNKGCSGGTKVTSTSNTTRVNSYQDHILAERKRREKLSQRFIALSALLPNLKKLDKASVLEDAIEYMKTLQEKVKILEEQRPKRTNVKLVRFETVADGGQISEKFPEIQARFSGKDVLIRIHCEKRTGVLENTLAEIEKLHLSVISSSAFIFANSAIHITVIAQTDKDSAMTMTEFVKNLRFGLKQFM